MVFRRRKIKTRNTSPGLNFSPSVMPCANSRQAYRLDQKEAPALAYAGILGDLYLRFGAFSSGLVGLSHSAWVNHEPYERSLAPGDDDEHLLLVQAFEAVLVSPSSCNPRPTRALAVAAQSYSRACNLSCPSFSPPSPPTGRKISRPSLRRFRPQLSLVDTHRHSFDKHRQPAVRILFARSKKMHSFITLTVATLTALTAAVPHARNHYTLHGVRGLDVEALAVKGAPIAGREVPTTNNLSTVGECGGSRGYGCAPGFCCSKWGYCGTTAEYCGAGGGSNSTGSGKSWPGHHGRPHHRPHKGKPHHKPPPVYSSPPGSASAAPAPSSAAPAPSSAAPAPSSYAPAPSSAAPAPSSAAPPASSAPAYSAPAPSASAPSGGSGGFAGYKMYSGSGSPSEGWPTESDWMDFESAFAASKTNMLGSCTQWGYQDDSAQEIDDIKSAIQSVASSSGMDERFILAVMMQESNGCVRVQTTDNGVTNPGLMQSHNGPGSCNSGTPMSPCPASEITQMIKDGVTGTPSGDGLQQCMDQCSTSGSQAYYQAAVIYNSGNLPQNLDDNTATPCYASDVANRLMGWTTGTSQCTLA